MSGPSRPIADGELAEVIEARAQRAKVDPALIGRVAAEAAASRQQRLGWWQSALRLFAPARLTPASIVATLAVVSLFGAALIVGDGTRPSESSSPSPSASRLASGPPPETTAYRFTSVDFLRYLREQPDTFVGHTVLVDGTLTLVPWPCPQPDRFSTPAPGDVVRCMPFTFETDGDTGPLVFAGSAAARSELRGSTSGTFAVRVDSPTRLIDIGRVTRSRSGDAWMPSALRALRHPAELYAVDGYLDISSRTYFCALQLSGVPHWCPPTWIADAPTSAPTRDEQIPRDAIEVPFETPRELGLDKLPARAAYLVRQFVPDSTACRAASRSACPGGRDMWLVAGRLDRVTVSAEPSP